ncbi:hypothetical protein FLX56_24015 [Synechococcus moorigangaii CMS01]|nr:hypothetical protein [Synechococcus moorigangaii CMS01]
MTWTTIKTTKARWEAEMMGEILTAHSIPNRVLDIGLGIYFGQGSQAALQVRSPDQWTARLLLSAPEDNP